MNNTRIDVMATTISGSIKDWGKVKQIVPLFNDNGYANVSLYSADSHKEARDKTCECIKDGGRTIISAGGSGTFNAVLEGCCDSGVQLSEITLGFLRKGSADLIGKTLDMPDNIHEAIQVFANSINTGMYINCDVLLAKSEEGSAVPRHFVGYGGAEIFGEIPYFTENRYTKYYKGLLSQLFGDLGPFMTGASLACIRKHLREIIGRKRKWKILVDNHEVSDNIYQAFIIVNGDLGKDLPLAKDVSLGSGDFYLFALRDLGVLKLTGQFKHTWNASVADESEKWGFEKYCIKESLELVPDISGSFEVNVDGSTMFCRKSVRFSICDRIKLISR